MRYRFIGLAVFVLVSGRCVDSAQEVTAFGGAVLLRLRIFDPL